jgi:hypothetical protein
LYTKNITVATATVLKQWLNVAEKGSYPLVCVLNIHVLMNDAIMNMVKIINPYQGNNIRLLKCPIRLMAIIIAAIINPFRICDV